MLSTLSRPRRRGLSAFTGVLLLTAAAAVPVAGQTLSEVASSEFALSSNEAALLLELESGRRIELAIRRGVAYVDGTAIGDAPRGSPLDRQWRELITRAMDAAPAELPRLLLDWAPDGGGVAGRFEQALDAALQNQTADIQAADASGAAPNSDSVAKLLERIGELEETVVQLESRRGERVVVQRPGRSRGPFYHITEGLAGIFSIVIAYAVLFGLGFVAIFFGGRKYIEGVADTARHATGRSLLVGIAATFLVVPAFVLGIIALVISVVGIPGLLVWVPGFPVAVLVAALLGYIGVAHAAGEAFAERRFYVTDWFQRGNSYYFLLTGLGLLLALFFASMVVFMAGPWLRAISGILMFLGVVSTIACVMIGFGATLISRGGKQPVRAPGSTAERDMFTEEAGV
jgi:hypothetical protein